MTNRPDVYTTIGQECGCCGHRHQSVQEAGQCLADFRRRGFSDRRVVAVDADGPWPPTRGHDLNDAELKATLREHRSDSPWPPTRGHDLNDAELKALYENTEATAR